MEGWTQPRLDDQLEGIGRTLTDIFRAAEADGITTDEAARRLAAERLAQAKAKAKAD
jgi:glutamate dehydrogenase/leucine dehydrogenase